MSQMIYHTGKMSLRSLRVVLKGNVNDIEVCQDISVPSGPLYALITIKERETAKQMLSIFGGEEKAVGGDGLVKHVFSLDTTLCFLFEYHDERALDRFGDSQLISPVLREDACINLVLSCLAARLPFPLLYLALDNENIHISKDNSVYFTPFFDLTRLDTGINEAECARKCLDIILDILGRNAKKRLKSLNLLRMKKASSSNLTFPELYRDIKITALPKQKKRFRQRITEFFSQTQDPLFRVLLVVCCVIFAFALIVLASQLIFGDIPLFRLFSDSFKIIGTEQLGK